jgi:hypothetical protein
MRAIDTLKALLGDGLTPALLVRALTVGVVLGSMPLVWGTSLLCLGAALLLRLNPLAVQVGNFAAWPIQILLAYPYLRLGAAWFGPVNPEGERVSVGLLHILVEANSAALGAWAVSSPLLLAVSYLASRMLVAMVRRKSG